MDAIVAAGVSPQHLQGQMELWDRLLQEFIAYLRDYSQVMAREQAAATPAPAETADSEA